ncbi:C4-type zinc ribbon domain-containing protein [Gordonia sp. Z-3]|uniref:zinc ribbon domain-containing protein n=1 Tax=Gordonia sp. Z-3 TaxID=3115408 RepID=UPI002E2D87FC|nr:C4-type zinc ribbon domain-containing protein [Gordonia sp. Z-3]MED5800991.1 C4-type zinc ribbon domain-containing protein [Gordonia sp. Z-3]
MKADPGAQRLLLDLADVDAEIARIDHRRASLPEDAELAELSKRVEVARDDLVRAEISAEDLTREYRRMEGEANGMAAREAKDSAQLTAGGLAPKALSELQHELNGLARRRAAVEDDMLGVMEQQEAVAAEQQRAAATIDQVDAEVATVRERRDRALAAATHDREAADARRTALIADIAPELLAIYDRQRASGRVGAGLLRARRCGACRMELDRGTIASISGASADDVIRCEECGAVLVRTAESGL